MIEWLKRRFGWMLSGGATEESDTEYDGFASYSAEIHALGNGFAKGLASKEMTAKARDSQKEIHYFRGAWAVGRLLRYLLVFMAGGQLL